MMYNTDCRIATLFTVILPRGICKAYLGTVERYGNITIIFYDTDK